MSSISVLANNKDDLERALDAAIDKAIMEATACPGKGILVTRHDYNSYSVKLTHEVPFGTTREQDFL